MLDEAGTISGLYDLYSKAPMLQKVSHHPDGTPKRLVMPAGPLDAPIVVVGEAPGASEERAGEPFVGVSGRLLQQMFAAAGLPWEFCYRANVLPWRPSEGNRTPYPCEIDASMDRVQAEIFVISPEIVIAAGAVAWQAVTRKQAGPFSAHRGKWMRWPPAGPGGFSCSLLAVYHPAALLHEAKNRALLMEAETRDALSSVLEGARAA